LWAAHSSERDSDIVTERRLTARYFRRVHVPKNRSNRASTAPFLRRGINVDIRNRSFP
jgi:hypothetical protein